MTNGYMKKCSTSLIIGEMQTKTIVRYHLAPVRMAIIKKPASVSFQSLATSSSGLNLPLSPIIVDTPSLSVHPKWLIQYSAQIRHLAYLQKGIDLHHIQSPILDETGP